MLPGGFLRSIETRDSLKNEDGDICQTRAPIEKGQSRYMAQLLEFTDEMKQRMHDGQQLAQVLAGRTAQFNPTVHPWNNLIHQRVEAWEELQVMLNPKMDEYRQERERLKEVLYRALPEPLRPLVPDFNAVWTNCLTTQLDAVFLLGLVVGQRLHTGQRTTVRKQRQARVRDKEEAKIVGKKRAKPRPRRK